MSTYTPRNDDVLVKREEWTQTDSGLLHVPADARASQRGYRAEGVVRAVGPGKLTKRGERVPLDVKPGDRVVFPSWVSHTPIDLDGEHFIQIKASDIAAIVEG